MEFNEKLQQLRAGKNLTQEQQFQNGKAAKVTRILSPLRVFPNSFRLP